MNLREMAEQRRKQIYNDLLKNKHDHDAIYINTHALSVKFKVNTNAIINDIKYLLDKSFIIPYIPQAKVYKIVRKNYLADNDLSNNLPKNIVDNLEFTEQEMLYLIKFEQHRKNINKPLDSQGYEMMIARAKYLKNTGENLVERIEYSISGGYPQIYETKNRANNNQLTFKERDEQNRINKIDNVRQSQANWFDDDNKNNLRLQNNE